MSIFAILASDTVKQAADRFDALVPPLDLPIKFGKAILKLPQSAYSLENDRVLVRDSVKSIAILVAEITACRIEIDSILIGEDTGISETFGTRTYRSIVPKQRLTVKGELSAVKLASWLIVACASQSDHGVLIEDLAAVKMWLCVTPARRRLVNEVIAKFPSIAKVAKYLV